MQLSSPSGVAFRHEDASIEDGGQATVSNRPTCLADFSAEGAGLETADGSLTITSVGAGKTVLLSIPHSDASAFHIVVSPERTNSPMVLM